MGKLKVKRAKNTKKKVFSLKKKHALTEENFLIIGLTIVCKTILTCLCIFEKKTCLDRRKFPYNWLDNSVQDNPYLSVHFLKKTKTVFFIDLANPLIWLSVIKINIFPKKKKKKKKKKKS